MLYILALLVAVAQAALVKVDSADDPLLVYVNGHYQGMTPVILEFDNGFYRVDFREDEFTGRTMRYSLEVANQSKGKLTCDWEMDDFRMIWAEDLQRSGSSSSSSSSSSRSSSSSGTDARREAEARLQAELERRRREEEARLAEEEYLDDGDEDDWEDVDDIEWADETDPYQDESDDLAWEEEERLRRIAEEEEARRRDQERSRDLAAEAARLEEEARQLEEQARQRAQEAKRLAAEDARRRAAAEAERREEEEDRRRAEAEAERQAEQRRREEQAARKREEEEARKTAEAERRRQEEEDRREAEEARRKIEEERERREEEARRAVFMPFRNEAEAAMKAGDTRLALRAYRKSVAAGDNDAETAAQIKEIEAASGSLRITVKGLVEDATATVTIDPPQGEPFDADAVSGSRYTFSDVPAGVALDLTIAGTGYQPYEQTVEPIRARRQARVNAELGWLGLATLELSDWPEGVEVAVTDLGGKHEPSEEGTLQVTAGRLVVALSGPSGKRQFLLELEPDASHAVAVRQELPGAVRLAGIPAGSRLSLTGSPEGAKLTTTAVPRDAGAQDQDGVGIAEPVLLQNLPPGEYTVGIDHPILGKGAVSFEPEPGETSEVSMVWETMSRAKGVRAARADWERRKARSLKIPLAHKLAMGTAGASVAVAGVSTAMLLKSLGDRSSLSDITDTYDQALTDGDYETAHDLYPQQTALQDSLRSANSVSLGGLTLTAAGLGVSGTLYLRGRAKKRGVEEWDLWALTDLPSAPDPVILTPPVEPKPERKKEKKAPEPEPEPEAEDAEEAPDPEPEAPAEAPEEPAPEEAPEEPKIDPDSDDFYIGPDEAFEPDFSPEEEDFEMEGTSTTGGEE
jgi:hypothetical protein